MLRLFHFIILMLASELVYAASVTVEIKTNSGQAAADIVVYALPTGGVAQLPLNRTALTISQKDKQFTPYISVVQQGAEVAFTNQDNITHHIYSAVGKNKFSFKLHADSEEKVIEFVETGDVPMGCNIHDWMSGHILVVATPYFSKTDQNGRASLSLAQLGAFKFYIWHPQLSEQDNKQQQLIDVETQDIVSFTLQQAMTPLPEQKGLDDFDFLEQY